jgi:hypothetical protein
MAGKGAGEVARDQGFALAGDGRSDEDGFGVIEFGVDFYRAINAEEGLAPAFVLVVENQAVFLAVRDAGEIGDDAEKGGADEVFHVPGGLDAVVDEGEAESDAEEGGEAENDGGEGVGLGVGGKRRVGWKRGVQRAHGNLLEVARGVGLGEAVEDFAILIFRVIGGGFERFELRADVAEAELFALLVVKFALEGGLAFVGLGESGLEVGDGEFDGLLKLGLGDRDGVRDVDHARMAFKVAFGESGLGAHKFRKLVAQAGHGVLV